MKAKIVIDLTGKDDVFLGKSLSYKNGLYTLDHFKNPPANLAENVADQLLGQYRLHHEGGKNGDRIQIALRKEARAALTDFFERAIHYLQAVATEDDIPAIRQAGFEVRQGSQKRSRKASHAAKPQEQPATLAGEGAS